MERTFRLIDHYLPPAEGFLLESLVATTYEIDFEFLEEELLAAALGVRSSVSRLKPFRSELERKLQKAEISVLYDLAGCGRLSRLSPRIDAIPVSTRKLHAKISLLMWIRENSTSGATPERRMRLIVGSANLTRQAFRHNYECIVSLDFGGSSGPPRAFLTRAIELVAEIASALQIPQLSRQLAAFSGQAATLRDEPPAQDCPIALVGAGDVVAGIRDAWATVSSKAPETVTVVSPFWTEGAKAHEALFQLFQGLGTPSNLELLCRGERAGDGKTWLPVFDSRVAVDLKRLLPSRLFLRAALPNVDSESGMPLDDSGDEQEEKEMAQRLGTQNHTAPETERMLHAKMILVDGSAGSVLYAGSSNCTRRGLGLGGPLNSEAGFIFRLTPRQRRQISGLVAFAGPAAEVCTDSLPLTIQPLAEDATVVPSFLAEVVASGTVVTLRFDKAIPCDAIVLMPIPSKAGDVEYWLLYRGDGQNRAPAQTVTADLVASQRCDERLTPLALVAIGQPIQPHVLVEVRWEGNSAVFPVRFDDKARLPLLLLGRKPTEGELIDYFLFGREPDEWGETKNALAHESSASEADAPVDTRRILAYLVRRFVQAIPGIEDEIRRASYSRAALDAALRGPTSPMELAERAFNSLTLPPACDEPQKTSTAVGFQLVEILAALRRCRSATVDPDLQGCFDPVMARCHDLLQAVSSQYAELQTSGFRLYRARVLGEKQ